MVALTGFSQSRRDIFRYANHKSLAFGFGYKQFGTGFGGTDKYINNPAMNVNVTAYGIYADFDFYNKDKRDGFRDQEHGYAFHVGYQFPVTKRIRIVPQIGYVHGKIFRPGDVYFSNSPIKPEDSSYNLIRTGLWSELGNEFQDGQPEFSCHQIYFGCICRFQC